MSHPAASTPSTTTSSAERSPRSDRAKPRFSLAIATAFGLGYLPSAPGTFGSLAGMVLAMLPFWSQMLAASVGTDIHFYSFGGQSTVFVDPLIPIQILLAVLVALTGVWTAHRSAQYWNTKDPQ